MIRVQTLPPEEIQQFDIEINFHYVRDLIEKCTQKLLKENVKLYYDQQCNYEINSDQSLQEARINQVIYVKVLENQSESISQYGDVICWFRQDGIDLEQGVQLRSDFTFEEVLDDAISKNIIQQMPKQIKVTNYRQTKILATLIEMQMYKLIEQNDKAPQLTIHFTTNDLEPQVDFDHLNQYPQKNLQSQGPKLIFQQTNQIQSSQNFQQFQNNTSVPPLFQQKQIFIQPNQQQNTTQTNLPQPFLQIPNKNLNMNNTLQSQQIFQGNIGQSGFIHQIQNNNPLSQNSTLNKQTQGVQQQINPPPFFTPIQINSDKNPNLIQPNQSKILVPPEKNTIIQQTNNQNTMFSPPSNKNPILGFPSMHNQQQTNTMLQNFESDAIKTLESMAQKCVESMITIGTFNFQINQNGNFVAYTSINPKLSGYFLENRGKNMLLYNEKNLKWETRFGVSIAQKENKGFIIKWKNNTYNSLSVNLL
ncbi:unnamed protein product [Paramecium primaurelia]|uniref:Uncharacterized protein n=1 Tax=Paramecium primaurelia TaxID=5886 RepID=A0A8S1PYY3_PARPR|nr:unnamed protein product [Paramecium primaurelia]